MGMVFAPTWLRQVRERPASHDNFNHALPYGRHTTTKFCMMIELVERKVCTWLIFPMTVANFIVTRMPTHDLSAVQDNLVVML